MTTHIDLTALPPVALLQEIARKRYDSAVAAECKADIAGFNKVSTALALNNLPFFDGHDWFVQSRQGGGDIYRLRQAGGVWHCDCTAGLKGQECWHVRMLTVVDAAWDQLADAVELIEVDAADCHDASGLIARIGAARARAYAEHYA